MLGALQNRTCRLSITLARSKRWRNGEEVFPWRRQLNELSRNSPSGNPQTYTKPGNSDCTFRRRHALHTIYPREDGHNVSLVQMSSSLRHQATSRLPNAKSQVAPLIHSFTTSFFFLFSLLLRGVRRQAGLATIGLAHRLHTKLTHSVLHYVFFSPIHT